MRVAGVCSFLAQWKLDPSDEIQHHQRAESLVVSSVELAPSGPELPAFVTKMKGCQAAFNRLDPAPSAISRNGKVAGGQIVG